MHISLTMTGLYLNALAEVLTKVEQDTFVLTPTTECWLRETRGRLDLLRTSLAFLDAELQKPLPPCTIPFGSRVRVVELFTKGSMGGPVVGSEGVTYAPDLDSKDRSLVWVKFETPLEGHDGHTWLYDPERPYVRYALPPRCVEILSKERHP